VELVRSGYDPLILDDYRNSEVSVIGRLEKIIGKVPEVIVGDVCDEDFVNEIFKNHELSGVIHFAAYKAVGESVEKPLKYYSNNISGLVSILKPICERGNTPFVFSSSCTVYGEPQGLKEVNEQTPRSIPTSPYGYTKWLGEQIINDAFKANHELKLMNLRYFNPIGAHPSGLIGELPIGKPNNLLPFITQTAAGIHDELVIFGNNYSTVDGTCIRDYIHVVDLAEAHVKAIDYLLSQDEGCCETVNIGTGTGTSVLELVNTFKEENDIDFKYSFGPERPGDVIEIFANVDYAKSLLGWVSKKDTRDAVKDAWNWEKKIRNIE
jgi:UDP-glucose 4-epimerase